MTKPDNDRRRLTYCEIRMPLCLLGMVGMVPFWLSSIDSRRADLCSLDHGISTNRMECGSGFWDCCDDEDGARMSDNDVGDSIDFDDFLSIFVR